jgi:hypothetical protein
MRTSLALFCARALLASPFFLAHLEADCLLGWPDSVYRWFDPWLPLVMGVCSLVITLMLPSIVSLFSDSDHQRLS